MIPRRAIFYWSGPPMGWLRQQSIESFKRMNPGWEISFIQPEEFGGADLIDVVHNSDFCRYFNLSIFGGLYFDTDIIFCRPIPDEWLEHDLVLPLGEDGSLGHIACLGSVPVHPFFSTCSRRAAELLARGGPLNYQALGVDLMREVMKSISLGKSDVKWISHDAFTLVPYFDVRRAWADSISPFPETSVGIHWYGGDHLSASIAPTVNEDWMRESKSLVAQAWRRSFVFEPEAA